MFRSACYPSKLGAYGLIGIRAWCIFTTAAVVLSINPVHQQWQYVPRSTHKLSNRPYLGQKWGDIYEVGCSHLRYAYWERGWFRLHPKLGLSSVQSVSELCRRTCPLLHAHHAPNVLTLKYTDPTSLAGEQLNGLPKWGSWQLLNGYRMKAANN